MRTKLLKRLRSEGRNQVNIYSVTKEDGIITGMSYGYNSDLYASLFSFGDTAEMVKEKACKIYLQNYLATTKQKKKH